MDIAFVALLVIGFILLIVVFLKSIDIIPKWVLCSMGLGITLIIFSIGIQQMIIRDFNIGKPAPLKMLVVGEKYEVVAICDGKYIVTKNVTITDKGKGDEKELRLIEDESSQKTIGGIYVKTAKGLEELK